MNCYVNNKDKFSACMLNRSDLPLEVSGFVNHVPYYFEYSCRFGITLKSTRTLNFYNFLKNIADT